MELSQGEKLILLALAAAKDGKEDIDLDFIRSAILGGHGWALEWVFAGIPNKDTDPAIANETAEILSMWSYIERCVDQLSPEVKEKLEKDAYPADLAFSGFDGNHDEHFGVAQFLIQDMKRYEQFKDRPLNSHSQISLPAYRAILRRYRAHAEQNAFRSGGLSAEAILSIVKN